MTTSTAVVERAQVAQASVAVVVVVGHAITSCIMIGTTEMTSTAEEAKPRVRPARARTVRLAEATAVVGNPGELALTRLKVEILMQSVT